MSWGRLDDSFDNHRKVRRAGAEAAGIYARSLAYCAGALTDGHVEREWLEERAGKRAATIASKLVASGLWEVNSAGWVIHDYLDYNPSREQILRKRAADSRRKAAGS